MGDSQDDHQEGEEEEEEERTTTAIHHEVIEQFDLGLSIEEYEAMDPELKKLFDTTYADSSEVHQELLAGKLGKINSGNVTIEGHVLYGPPLVTSMDEPNKFLLLITSISEHSKGGDTKVEFEEMNPEIKAPCLNLPISIRVPISGQKPVLKNNSKGSGGIRYSDNNNAGTSSIPNAQNAVNKALNIPTSTLDSGTGVTAASLHGLNEGGADTTGSSDSSDASKRKTNDYYIPSYRLGLCEGMCVAMMIGVMHGKRNLRPKGMKNNVSPGTKCVISGLKVNKTSVIATKSNSTLTQDMDIITIFADAVMSVEQEYDHQFFLDMLCKPGSTSIVDLSKQAMPNIDFAALLQKQRNGLKNEKPYSSDDHNNQTMSPNTAHKMSVDDVTDVTEEIYLMKKPINPKQQINIPRITQGDNTTTTTTTAVAVYNGNSNVNSRDNASNVVSYNKNNGASTATQSNHTSSQSNGPSVPTSPTSAIAMNNNNSMVTNYQTNAIAQLPLAVRRVLESALKSGIDVSGSDKLYELNPLVGRSREFQFVEPYLSPVERGLMYNHYILPLAVSRNLGLPVFISKDRPTVTVYASIGLEKEKSSAAAGTTPWIYNKKVQDGLPERMMQAKISLMSISIDRNSRPVNFVWSILVKSQACELMLGIQDPDRWEKLAPYHFFHPYTRLCVKIDPDSVFMIPENIAQVDNTGTKSIILRATCTMVYSNLPLYLCRHGYKISATRAILELRALLRTGLRARYGDKIPKEYIIPEKEIQEVGPGKKPITYYTAPMENIISPEISSSNPYHTNKFGDTVIVMNSHRTNWDSRTAGNEYDFFLLSNHAVPTEQQLYDIYSSPKAHDIFSKILFPKKEELEESRALCVKYGINQPPPPEARCDVIYAVKKKYSVMNCPGYALGSMQAPDTLVRFVPKEKPSDPRSRAPYVSAAEILRDTFAMDQRNKLALTLPLPPPPSPAPSSTNNANQSGGATPATAPATPTVRTTTTIAITPIGRPKVEDKEQSLKRRAIPSSDTIVPNSLVAEPLNKRAKNTTSVALFDKIPVKKENNTEGDNNDGNGNEYDDLFNQNDLDYYESNEMVTQSTTTTTITQGNAVDENDQGGNDNEGGVMHNNTNVNHNINTSNLFNVDYTDFNEEDDQEISITQSLRQLQELKTSDGDGKPAASTKTKKTATPFRPAPRNQKTTVPITIGKTSTGRSKK